MLKNIVYIYDQAYLSGGAAKIAFGEALEMQKKDITSFSLQRSVQSEKNYYRPILKQFA